MEAAILYGGPCPGSRAGARAGAAAGPGSAAAPSLGAAMDKAASSSLLFQKDERCGPFSSNLRGTAAQVAGNSLPEARPRCSEPATACCIHLTAVCIPALSLPDSLPRLAKDVGRPEQPLAILALHPGPPSRGAQQLPGNTSHRLLSWGTATGLAPAVLQFNHPQVFKTKSIKIQRCLPNGERQELF